MFRRAPYRLTGMKKILLATAFALLLLPAAAYGQATRTWVSGTGDDAFPCSRTAPCKTWAGAMTNTATNGEITALDSGGFGTLTITKSITIDGGAAFGSTLAALSPQGFLINIPSTDTFQRVALRNLSINGAATGSMGVRIESAEDVRLENVQIKNLAQNGVDFTPAASAPAVASLSLRNVSIDDSGRNGLQVGSATGQQLRVSVDDSVIVGSDGRTAGSPGTADTGIGIAADTGARVWLTGTTIFDNRFGIRALANYGAPGTVESSCDNAIGGNDEPGLTPTPTSAPQCTQPGSTTTTVTNTVTAPAPPPITVTQTVTVPARTTPTRCVVPKVTGLTLKAATTKLRTAKCALGVVTKKTTTRKARIGRVITQGTAAGRSVAAGTKVKITVGRR